MKRFGFDATPIFSWSEIMRGGLRFLCISLLMGSLGLFFADRWLVWLAGTSFVLHWVMVTNVNSRAARLYRQQIHWRDFFAFTCIWWVGPIMLNSFLKTRPKSEINPIIGGKIAG